METRTMKWIGLALVAAVLFTIAPAAQAAFPTDEPYRIMFVTSVNVPVAAGTQPGDTNMGALNAWVTGLAEAVPELDALGTTWSVIGATTAVNVFDNTDTEPGVDTDTGVYMVDGTMPWANLAEFWSVAKFPFGTKIVNENGGQGGGTMSAIHTGLDGGPATAVGFELDAAGRIQHGGYDDGYTPWYGGTTWFDWEGINGSSLFAVSGVINDVPEPATMSLLAIGGIALLRRKRR